MAEFKTGTTLGSNNVATAAPAPSVRFGTEDFSFYSLLPSGVYANNSVIFKDSNGAVQLGTIVGELDVTITKSPTANSEVEGNTIVYSASASPVPLVQGRTINYHLSGTYSPSDLSPSSNVGSFVFPASSPGVATSTTYTVVADGVTESPESLSLTLTDVYPANSISTTIQDVVPSYVGDTSAYIIGGVNGSYDGLVRDQQKFPFSSETSASSLGDQAAYARSWRGGAGPTSGYIIGGIHYPSSSFPGTSSYSNYQKKFPFSSETINSMPGWLTTPTTTASGIFDHATHNDDSYLFVTGGKTVPSPPAFSDIERMPFSSEGSWIDIGELAYSMRSHGAHSSDTDGYAVGGDLSYNSILKFPFVGSGSMSTDIGELPYEMSLGGSGVSSPQNGYTVGGGTTPYHLNNSVYKFPFSSDTPASTLVNQNTYYGSTHSSQTDGYTSGRSYSPPFDSTAINKFTFSSDANSSDIGELNTGIYGTPSAAFHT